MTLELAGLRSIRVPDPVRLTRLERIGCVVIVGSTCTGKSTLVQAIRQSSLCTQGLVDVPVRYLTRPPRGGDDTVENVYVSADEFASRSRAGEIAIAWQREIEAGRIVSYGFAAPRAGALAVYSANNALFVAGAELSPPGAFADALWIGVVAPDPLRAERLQHRSPDLWSRPGEVARRLEDRASSVEGHVHVIVDNHGELEAVAIHEVLSLVERARTVVG
jgi:ribose 1,5-bisphosphokinase PhnN